MSNGAGRSHVLVLPSEEYLPPRQIGPGIFQKHQIDAMRSFGPFRFGVISVRLQYSVTMYARALAYALVGGKVDNALGGMSPKALLGDLNRRLQSPRECMEVEMDRGYPVLRATGLYLVPPSPRFDHHWWVRAGWTAFCNYVERFGRPDLIHAHNTLNAGLLAHEINRRTGIPYVLTEHSSYYHQGLVPRGLRTPVAETMRKARAVFAVSDALRRSLVSFLGTKRMSGFVLDVLPNVLPDEFSKRTSLAVLPPGQRFAFLAVGNLLPIKGHDVLLRAFSRICAAHPGCRLRIIGDGPLRQDLERLACELGIQSKVSFLGVSEPQIVFNEMLTSNALVLSSHYETFGVAAIEALSCGLPVVATRCGGPETIVGQQDGIFADPGDEKSLAAAMARMIETRASFDGAAIQRSAFARFGRAVFAARLERIYEQAWAS